MRRLFTPLLIVTTPLALVACSAQPDETDSPTTKITTEESPTNIAEPITVDEGSSVPKDIGELAGFDCSEPNNCAVEFTVEDIEVLENCDGYEFDNRPEETRLMRATILISTKESTTGYDAGTFPVWTDWSALTNEGLNHDLPSSSWCSANNSDQWNNALQVGDTERRVHYMDVPNDSSELRVTETLSGSRWVYPMPNS